jgi:cytochrome P450
LCDELMSTFGEVDHVFRSDLLDRLLYLNAVIDEALRLGAQYAGLPRVVPTGGIVLDGVFIPEGTIVGVQAYTQAISEDNFWPEPLAFKPERWLPGGLGPFSRARRSAIMAFSSGMIVQTFPLHQH